MLKAMPAIIESEPTVLYIILGMTHPQVLKYDGESYRFSLQRLAEELGCSEHVMFVNRFVSDEELHNFLCAADVYITPYQNVEQLTSGTLSFAVGAGKAVVSTPYWAAEELLADGRGKLVRFGDPKQLAEAIVEIFKDDSLYYSLRRKAYDYGRSRIWPQIGQAYWKLFNTIEQPAMQKYRNAGGADKGENEYRIAGTVADSFKKTYRRYGDISACQFYNTGEEKRLLHGRQCAGCDGNDKVLYTICRPSGIKAAGYLFSLYNAFAG